MPYDAAAANNFGPLNFPSLFLPLRPPPAPNSPINVVAASSAAVRAVVYRSPAGAETESTTPLAAAAAACSDC